MGVAVVLWVLLMLNCLIMTAEGVGDETKNIIYVVDFAWVLWFLFYFVV